MDARQRRAKITSEHAIRLVVPAFRGSVASRRGGTGPLSSTIKCRHVSRSSGGRLADIADGLRLGGPVTTGCVLVTGAFGLVGSAVVAELAGQDRRVVATDLDVRGNRKPAT